MAVPWHEIAAHRERLIRVARRRCPTREDAEDVVHEAMLRCATFEELDEKRLGQFLTAVTVRLCADIYRGTERSLRAVRSLEADNEPSPEDLACAAAEAEELRTLLDTLPDRQRAVLLDRAFGLSVTQISDRHALTYKATESTLSRARASMRLALASAMALVTAAFATVRRRPSVVLAVPLTALAVASTVHYTESPPAAAPEVRIELPGGHGSAHNEAWERPDGTYRVRSTVALAPAATTPRAPRPKARYEERTIVEVHPAPFVHASITDEDGETPEEMVQRCVEAESYSVDARLDLDDPDEKYYVNVSCEPNSTPQEGARP